MGLLNWLFGEKENKFKTAKDKCIDTMMYSIIADLEAQKGKDKEADKYSMKALKSYNDFSNTMENIRRDFYEDIL
jgi:hypothetical protein